MKKYLILFLRKLLTWVESAKGKRVLEQAVFSQNPYDGYKIIMSDDSVVSIYCVETKYVLTYTAWWSRKKQIHMYSVYSVCSSTTPVQLKIHFSKELKIGNLLHPLATSTECKKAAVEAYVDMLLADAAENRKA